MASATTPPTLFTPSSRSSSTPILVSLTRPKCFCGFTSVSIYPHPTDHESRYVRKTNWVYECHFTPQQRDMVKPDPCDDCEEDRRRVLSSDKGTNNCEMATNSRRERKSALASDNSLGIGRSIPGMRHKAVRTDQVELWPSASPTILGFTAPSPTTLATTTVIGADVENPATFWGLSPLDGDKVCGFHMHALEWHHMQTIEIDQILALAKQTKCDVFNMSIVRWLGDNIRPISCGPNKITPIATANNNAEYRNSEHLELKLFKKVSCSDCRIEAVIAVVPKHVRPRPFNAPQPKHDYYGIVCRGKALSDPAYKIVEPRVDNDGYGYGHYKPRTQPKGKILTCDFCLTDDIVIYGHNIDAIHKHSPTSPWLAQWLPPSPKLSNKTASSLRHLGSPIPASWAYQPRPILPSSYAISGDINTTSFRSTDQMANTPQNISSIETAKRLPPPSSKSRVLATPAYTERISVPSDVGTTAQRQAIYSLSSQSLSVFPLLTSALPCRGQMQESSRQVAKRAISNPVTVLQELDRELEGAIAQHNVKVALIMNSKERQSDPFWDETSDPCGEYPNYREFDMEDFPGVEMMLCKVCQDSAREFCVVPAFKHQQRDNALPPSPPQSPEDYHYHPSTPPLSRTVDTKSMENVDRELEEVMIRHARHLRQEMETRSRLIPFFLHCESCKLHQMEVDVVPCNHLIMCAACLDRIEFYVVPRQIR
ncbi:hypothetical protein FBU30_008989 [Linnemannia zychae]|nr:hypothetical protein FBU30_008989 [Linnemannia zychae]